VNGSVSNTAVNYESGAKTQLSGGFAAVVIILVLLFLPPSSATFRRHHRVVIIASMVALIDYKALKGVLAFDRLEFLVPSPPCSACCS